VERTMNPLIVKHSVVIEGHKTSVSLEEPFWSSLKEIAATDGKSLSQVVSAIDKHRDVLRRGNLSSAIRLHVLERYRPQAIKKAA
jgi:predicted DNA-binding ribbon-helix-helix protein